MKKILVVVIIIIALSEMVYIYVDTTYLRRAVVENCFDAVRGSNYESLKKKYFYITFKEVLLNRSKYQKLLKEKCNISDYAP